MSLKDDLRDVFKESSIYFLADLLPKTINFFLLPIYTIYLAKSDYGTLSLAQTFGTFFQIVLLLGMDSALLRFYFQYRNEPEKLKRCIGTVITFLCITAIPVIILMLLGGPLLVKGMIKSTEFTFYPYVLYALLMSVFYMVPQVYVQLYRAQRKPWRYFAFKVASFAITSLLVVYFVVFAKESAEGSLKGQCIGAAVFFIIYLFIYLTRVKVAFDWKMLKDVLHFGLPLVPASLTGWILISVDRLIIERFMSLASLGIYAMAQNFCLMVDMSINAFNSAYAPYCYDLMSRDSERAKITMANLGKAFTALGCAATLLFMCEVEGLVRLMTVEAYHVVYPVAEAMAIYFVFRVIWCAISPPIIYFKKTNWLFWITLVIGLTNAGLDLLLVPKIGLYGAIIGTVFAGGILRLVVIYFPIRKIYPIPYSWDTIAKIMVLFAVCGTAVFLIDFYVDSFGLLWKQLIPLAFIAGLFGMRIVNFKQLRALFSLRKSAKTFEGSGGEE